MSEQISIPYRWKPRDYQMEAWKYLEEGGKRAVLVWNRRSGKDLFCLNWLITQMFERIGSYWHVFPTYAQGRKAIWDGATNDGRPFLDHFPHDLIHSRHDNEMKIQLKNGSIYQVVGSDEVDKLMGSNPVGLIFSEHSIANPIAWDLTRPIIMSNGGWVVFNFTPRGHNHAYDLLKMAKKNIGWFSQVLTVNETKTVTEAQIQEERDSGMSEPFIQQEYFCSFEAPLIGAYYADQFGAILNEKRITNVPYERKLPVYTSWDIGMDDYTSIWFYQLHYMEIRLIDFYEDCNKALTHYIKIVREKPYVYETHYAPHDITVREFTTGKSRIETARNLGIKFRIVQRHDVNDGIDAVRSILSRCWFDEKKCEKGIEALKSYHKEYDDKKQMYNDKPSHDWSSHAADSFRMMAWTVRDGMTKKKQTQTKALDDYSILSY